MIVCLGLLKGIKRKDGKHVAYASLIPRRSLGTVKADDVEAKSGCVLTAAESLLTATVPVQYR